MIPNPYVSTKILSARKLLRQFLDTLDVKHKTEVCRLGAAIENIKAIIICNVFWPNITNRRGHTK